LWADESWFLWSLWLFSIIGGIPLGILGLLKVPQREMFILNSSIFGGYMFMVGLDFFAQDQFGAVLINMFAGKPTLIYPWFVSLVMCFVWGFFAVFGFFVQSKLFAKGFVHRPKYEPVLNYLPDEDEYIVN
jgi:hypothetical protein